ncbi:hypothetical protein R1sor_026469 [Riccia sorocarpa]|uniref:Neprosin PEP catalytic domain-containing protein n=1 Tax=Riccia sorocarpa TaxID=122646 RepID=A0ABD3GCZ3_9MARC
MENYLGISLILVLSFCLQCSYSAESALQFKLSSGEEISCVPIYEQPSLKSLDHASSSYLKLRSEDGLEGVPLDLQPSEASTYHWEPKYIPSQKSAEEPTQVIPDEMEVKLAEQLFKSEVGTCPEGMIPILRNQRPIRRTRGVIRQGADSRHGNFQHIFTVTSTDTSEADPANASPVHEYAENYFSPGGALYRGANGYFNVWKPTVELSGEFSLSQLWITAGSYDQNNLNTIEVGWQVYKDIYGDDQPHLFVYWTRDAYKSTGCYNLACPGFVQVSTSLVVGGSLSSFVSQTNGAQYEIQVLVFWDQGTNAWWLNINGQNIGYWPNSLFTTLTGGANNVDWGGEIVNSETGNRHTQTDMGSGQFAQTGFQKAAFIRSLQTVNQQNQLVDAPLIPADVLVTNANCYSAQTFQDTSAGSTWRTYLFFGGPGFSNACPK